MRAQKVPERREWRVRKDLRQRAARDLISATIDQMHYRHGWIPGLKCGQCMFFQRATCEKFYGNKRVSISARLKWKSSHDACGMFAIDGEPALRTSTRRARAIPAGESPHEVYRQKGLFV